MPLLVKPMVLEEVISSATPQSTFFMPSVETKGWGRSRRVSSVPFIKPASVDTRMATGIRIKAEVMPKFCIRTPIVQVARMAL